jgi:hypothetical protein
MQTIRVDEELGFDVTRTGARLCFRYVPWVGEDDFLAHLHTYISELFEATDLFMKDYMFKILFNI